MIFLFILIILVKGVLNNYKVETTVKNKTEINRKLLENETQII